MTQVILFAAFGLFFLALLLFWVLTRTRQQPDSSAAPVPRGILGSFNFNPPSAALTGRIFAREDWEFVVREADSTVQAVFLQERRVLARAWVREMRGTVTSLMRFHRDVVRHHADLSPWMEWKFMGQYGMFLLGTRVLDFLLWLRGPFQTLALVDSVGTVLNQVFSTYEEILAVCEPDGLDRIRVDWAQRTAAGS